MRYWSALLALCTLASVSEAQTRTTQDGVYNRQQWLRGQDLYLGSCRSCHTPESHASEVFTATWNGRTLADLYAYMRASMPKSEPGSMSAQEYADVIAYVLRLNRMPAGNEELPTDTLALRRIRFTVEAKTKSSPGDKR